MVAMAKFIGKMQKKSGIMKSGLDVMPLFFLDDLLRHAEILNLAFPKLDLKIIFAIANQALT